MNAKANFYNIGVMTTTAIGMSLGTMACNDHTSARLPQTPQLTYPNVAPSDYGIEILNITTDHTGKAIIKLDSFTLLVGFEYLAHPDSYGVAGSEYTAVEITNITIDQIVDIDGKYLSDFTDHNDILNIKQLLVTYIEKNQLVEVMS
ncbi:hypothetical protein [Acinetobacter stercoris]|uniref:Uncharacterized protein n=1 Tax=Acinetobacter stercoris TaxID=2126983 RepID=A0A2U3N2W9_9GAMM|nr:hypothetical protein [Acinetobacter stercoris]SPL72021.1 hypothetical protein KPC_3199 [Acinetobacter stercoris]